MGDPFNGSAPDIGAFETGSFSGEDGTRPVVSAFTIPSTSTSLTVPLSTFTATDNIGVTGYLVNETAATPSISNSSWTSSAPTTYFALSTGTKTLYAWSKDGAGNVSAALTNGVIITMEQLPTAIENIDKTFKIDVFPNPCVDNVTIRFSKTPKAGSEIDIIDLTGRKVVTRKITNSEELISLSEQPAGLYLVKTIIDSHETITKLIINK